ncbi:MAG: hypothetical protein II381_00950 [Victivallales bacterium]|nr:hypothetical protein [Victivallales bacterium]
MPFDINALNTFSNVNLKKTNAIVNIGNDNTVSKKGSYHGAVGRMFRVSSTKAANNAVPHRIAVFSGKRLRAQWHGPE